MSLSTRFPGGLCGVVKIFLMPFDVQKFKKFLDQNWKALSNKNFWIYYYILALKFLDYFLHCAREYIGLHNF